MKIFNLIKYALVISSVVYIFINWKIAIGLFLLATIFYVIPLGVNALLGVITGYLLIAGIVSLFINWKISIVLVLFAYLTIKFRIWGNIATEKYNKEEADKIKNIANEKIKDANKQSRPVYSNEIGQSFSDSDLDEATYLAGDLMRSGVSRPDALTQASEKYGVPRSAINSLLSTFRKVDNWDE